MNRSIFTSILTYGTDVVGTKTIYRNDTPLPDAIGLETDIIFRLKVLLDSTGGTGDSQIRFGISAPGITLAMALVTSSGTGIRYVLVYDQKTGIVVGGVPFDFLDNLFHTYRIVRNAGLGNIRIYVDP